MDRETVRKDFERITSIPNGVMWVRGEERYESVGNSDTSRYAADNYDRKFRLFYRYVYDSFQLNEAHHTLRLVRRYFYSRNVKCDVIDSYFNKFEE